MATILLSAAGAAIGGGFGGTVLGLSGAVIGRAAGAVLGRALDQRLMGAGSAPVETGRLDRLRLTGASEGAALGRVWGRVRLGGQVIWASPFTETATTQGGGKGAPRPRVTSYSYAVSLAIGLCEGEVSRVGRIWADGQEIDPAGLTWRLYPGSETQLPDPLIAALEGALAPAYRGTAYVVIEQLALAPFGNRVPQFTFEVMRRAAGAEDMAEVVPGVALIPGSGEYALAARVVRFDDGLGGSEAANTHSAGGTDLAVSLRALDEELPGANAVSLVVSWFAGDLRAGHAQVKPKVEQQARDAGNMPWVVSGIARAQAEAVALVEGRPVYGGTPADASVREAIAALKAKGKAVTFYPFVLMDQLAGNGLPDPYGAEEQAALPWRGRITAHLAPGRAGSPDGTSLADAEVAAFFGATPAGAFTASGETVSCTAGDWGYRRFILHYAHLCAAAGGVDAFCIGSELRGLTRLRGASGFPAVTALRQLAQECRTILGPGCKIGYAADWSEYGGYQTPEGELRFPLDPLWADPAVDFVGIDNYLPLSDWREGDDHADAGWGSVYNPAYLAANVEGGELYDWFYPDEAHRKVQARQPITDGEGEPFVWRAKDLRGWWGNTHHDRSGGVRSLTPTPWVPRSKPIWFTELGCGAIDKGANAPNLFLDPKSSESALPPHSDGRRDDLMQLQALRATLGYWAAHNEADPETGVPLIALDKTHVWAWDARPFPAFPDQGAVWGDGANYARGHWLNGRATAQPLASVVREICAQAGVTEIDVSNLWGLVTGYHLSEVSTARAALQPLMLAYGFDAVERDGVIRFRNRDAKVTGVVDPAHLVVADEAEGAHVQERAEAAAQAGRLRLGYLDAGGAYEARAAEAILPDEADHGVAESELPLVLRASEARGMVTRWLSEARVARDGARFTLPPSLGAYGPGDVLELDLGAGPRRFRVDKVEEAGARAVDAVRVEPEIYRAPPEEEEAARGSAFVPAAPVLPVFLDLPLMSGAEDPVAPHLAVAARPWGGPVAVWQSGQDTGYALNRLIERGAVIGRTLSPLPEAPPGLWDRGAPLRVLLGSGTLESVSDEALFSGANLIAIGDGQGDWELLQFARAELVAPRSYDLSRRLRGQAGTDAVTPALWPAGSLIVRLDGAPVQLDLPLAQRGLLRHWRIGPASRPYDDPIYRHEQRAFAGVGLRPYAPCHLRVARQGGDVAAKWLRRTRLGGDGWEGYEVPLAEEREAYLVTVLQAGVKRQAEVATPSFTYTAAMQAADGVTGPFTLRVQQISVLWGPGPAREVVVA